MEIVILGSTGTIGRNTLDVLDKLSGKYKIYGLTAKTNILLLIKQIKKYKPKYVVVDKISDIEIIKKQCPSLFNKMIIFSGKDGLNKISSLKNVKCVVSAIVGGAALEPTYHAVKSGKKVLLANKESLIMSGKLLLKEASNSKSIIIPIDSEHNALLQIISFFGIDYMKDKKKLSQDIANIYLTASGGPFLGYSKKDLSKVTPNQAIKHPNWKMGKKISVDSATMMNKGLEVIEASILFGIEASKINVYIHPQSIIHALITFYDGSTISHMSYHDMKIPISYALNWPKRKNYGKKIHPIYGTYDLSEIKSGQYPCFDLCIKALKIGKNAPIIVNAANEVAVEYFLENKIKFTDIPSIIKYVLNNTIKKNILTIPGILKCDNETRKFTQRLIEKKWK